MSNLPTNASNLIASLIAAAPQITTAADSSGMDFLKLSSASGWTYGQDNVEVEDGAKWALNPASMSKGFIAWSDNSKVLGDVLQVVTKGLVTKAELPELNEPSDGWAEQCAFQLVCLTGEDSGTNVMYKASTQGGNKEFARVYGEIVQRGKAEKPDIVPIVVLEKGQYQHGTKKYGMVTFPVFKIVGWQNLEDEVYEEAPVVEAEVEEAPKRRRRKVV